MNASNIATRASLDAFHRLGTKWRQFAGIRVWFKQDRESSS